jgi:negative regulator of sigma E activity
MTNTDRDRSIETLLRSHRADDDAQVSSECLDAEALAAWMDGELPEPARLAAEQHAAGCARCQALLASMARTEPDSEVRPWWSSLTAKWLVPVAALATAVVVWVSVERVRPTPASSTAPRTAAAREQLPTGPAPAVAPRVMAPPEQDKLAPDAQQLADRRAKRLQDLQTKTEAVRDEKAGSRGAAGTPKPASPPQPVAGVAGGVANRNLDAAQPLERARADTAARSASPPAAAPVPPAQAEPILTPVPVPAAPSPQQKAAAKAMAETVSPAPPSSAPAFATGSGGGRGNAVPVEIRSPESRYRWRIIPPAGIQRSTDDGATWAVVDPIGAGVSADNRSPVALIAGSSPARDVCWIVGRAGVVLLSTNGATWQRRPFPEAVDLTAVRGVSASSAEVTTADGRRFATADGGVTWTPMK